MKDAYSTIDCLEQESSRNCIWYIGQPMENFPQMHSPQSDNVTTVVKATCLLHNILTVPADKVPTEVIGRGKIFDDAVQDLANVGSQPATAANDVRNYLTEYFNSVAGSVEWQNDYPHVH